MIQYMPRAKTRSEEILKRLLADKRSDDRASEIERNAASIATAMASIHGGEWRVLIDHQAGYVTVIRH
ncbi:hypothetical protein EN851_07625 [Mesorhizobium sp. M8A.F.Ca.ET.208.01.1.1]|uniref:hypothetical protein n=1 Tax=unclassified Mesorhizobium TaxID=325217 RepID=UPI0010940C6A|nr:MULTISPECIES: hypothetical protein [unclassified Mesorhizobium]TGQ95383.1 hypothetical protein EN851_07625 [Mesorhizobium sp. M8A.F.Ca.ET.208.01.1.1]TGT55874.1 hypothetical protein EN810_07625 [Mesorhizobium sp. M8A.F.Ca.ET.167.01.1.1]